MSLTPKLTDAQYYSFLCVFNEFPNEPSDLRDLCEKAGLDIETKQLVLCLAETYIGTQKLLKDTTDFLEKHYYYQIEQSWREYYAFMKIQLDWWMSGHNYSNILSQIKKFKPYSQWEIRKVKNTKRTTTHFFIDDVINRVEHYSDQLPIIAKHLSPLYD